MKKQNKAYEGHRFTVEGELSVAKFIDNFLRKLRGKPVACVACTQRYHQP
jgi:hypothetical protein